MKQNRFFASLRMTRGLRIAKGLMMTVALLAFLAAGQSAWAASTFTISNSNNVFTITRTTNTSTTETVYYRTVDCSAIAGYNYTATSGSLVFDKNHNSYEVVVQEKVPSLNAYKFQTTSRSYYLELLDQDGFRLGSRNRSISYGSDFTFNSHAESGAYDLDDVHTVSFPYTGAYTITDDGYDSNPLDYASDHKYFSLARTEFYDDGTRNYLATVAEIRMMLEFKSYETRDGYQYVQILTDNITSCDNRKDCSNGDPGNISLSRYMAGFEMDTGSLDEGQKRYTFPVASAGNNEGASNPWGYSSDGKFPLSKQKFNTGCRASDGMLILNPNFNTIVLRFNASGSGEDHWIVRDMKATVYAVDGTAPSVLNGITVSPGPYNRGNDFYVSVPFSECVVGGLSLTTSWGTASKISGGSSNVLTFKGIIDADAGTELSVSALDGNVSDHFNNSFSGSVSKTFSGVTSANPEYTISYDLDGGSLPAGSPESYTWDSETFTLTNPVRLGYRFTGWTGSNGSSLYTVVTIPNHSHSDLSYTAHWEQVMTGSGTSADPYVITTAKGLDALAQYVNAGNDCGGLFFVLGNDIAYSHTTAWNNAASTENNYTPIGTNGNYFKGTFDGCGYTVSGIRIYRNGKGDADRYLGLFGHVRYYSSYSDRALVRRVKLADTRITGYFDVGGIAGQITLSDVEDCVVGADVCIHAALKDTHYHGGVVGSNHGTVQRCISRVTLTAANTLECDDFGSFVGCNTSGQSIMDCIALGTTIPDVANAGAITGANYGDLLHSFYRSCTVAGTPNATNVGVGYESSNHSPHDYTNRQGALALYSLTLPAGVTLSRTLSATLPEDGYATYDQGADIDGLPYAFEGCEVTLVCSGGSNPVFCVNGTPIEGNTFTMPAADVAVSFQSVGFSLSQGTKDGVTAWWGTFYSGSNRYSLPEGAAAYTMGYVDNQYHLYRLGTDGRVIPEGKAVVIISTKADVTISLDEGSSSIVDHAPGGNILYVSDSPVILDGSGKVPVPGSSPAATGTPYVLSLDGTAIGFRQFTGASIPAGKAYYVATTE